MCCLLSIQRQSFSCQMEGGNENEREHGTKSHAGATWAALAVAQQCFSALPPFVRQPLSCPALRVPSGHPRLDLFCREQIHATPCVCGDPVGSALLGPGPGGRCGRWSSELRQRPSQGPGTGALVSFIWSKNTPKTEQASGTLDRAGICPCWQAQPLRS